LTTAVRFGTLGAMFEKTKLWARRIKTDVVALYIAGRDRRTPRLAKVVALAVAAYALSPIDLIPDFIPVLGYLDDLIIVPLGIMLAVRLIPTDLMDEFRTAAQEQLRLPPNRLAAAMMIGIWLASLTLVAWWLAPRLWPQ
jgi:uncharacterized membrane protein YkvA (DUF1232 family)